MTIGRRFVIPPDAVIKSVSQCTTNSDYIQYEDAFIAPIFRPLPVVLSRGEGVYAWDVTGKQYLDFCAAYGSVSQGHCHPVIRKKMIEQLEKLTLTSRAFFSDALSAFGEYMSKTFGYDRVLPLISGVEATDTAVKLCRKWAYKVKKIPDGEAVVLFPKNNFWGRSLGAISTSSDPLAYNDFAPYLPGFQIIPFNDVDALKNALESNPNIAGFVVEPIQGEAGVIIPDKGYLTKCHELCKKHNVLLVCDEIQVGLGRTGKLLASDHDNVKPDIMVLGKALSGGQNPIACVLADNDVMLLMGPGEHGSTFGGNPLSCVIAMYAVDLLFSDGLIDNAAKMGVYFLSRLEEIKAKYPFVKDVRGVGLMCAVELDEATTPCTAFDLCYHMCTLGLLCKDTRSTKIRLMPPLLVNQNQIDQAITVMDQALHDAANYKVQKAPC